MTTYLMAFAFFIPRAVPNPDLIPPRRPQMGSSMPKANSDRLDAWFDGSPICVIAVGSQGDPLDLNEGEVELFIAKLKSCLEQAK